MNQDRIHIYKQVLEDLEAEHQAIETHIHWVKQKIRALHNEKPEPVIPLVYGAETKPTRKPRVRQDPAQPNKRGVTDTVEIILNTQGIPLHGKVILQQLHALGHPQTTMRSLTGALPQDARKRFENLGKNTWALTAWNNIAKGLFRDQIKNEI